MGTRKKEVSPDIPGEKYNLPCILEQFKGAKTGDTLVFPCNPNDVHRENKNIQVGVSRLGIKFESKSFTGISNNSPRTVCGFLVFNILSGYDADKIEEAKSKTKAETISNVEFEETESLEFYVIPEAVKLVIGKRMLRCLVPHYVIQKVLGWDAKTENRLLGKTKKKIDG